MGENISRLQQPLRAIPIPATAEKALSILGGVEIDTTKGITYKLRRRKEGTEVSFIAGSLVWSVSIMTGHYPKNFAEARKWVAEYAEQRGQTIPEHLEASDGSS